LEKIIIENHKKYSERIALYKSLGYDIEEERKFVLEKIYPLYGDILEVGTGKGYFTIELAKKGYNFTSIDISPQEQEFARLNLKYLGFERLVDFKIEDAEHLNFDDSSFDIIVSVNTLHHFINPFKVMDELVRIIASEGKIILSDFTKEGLKIVDKIHNSEGRRHNVSQTVLPEIGSYLRSKRFNVQKYQSTFQDVLIAYC